TGWLRRLYVIAFIAIGSRPIDYFALTSKPDTAWMLQQARNLLMQLDHHNRPVRFLIHDRDAKFPRAFDALLASGNIKVIRTPVRAPNANAHMKRWVGSVRRELPRPNLDHRPTPTRPRPPASTSSTTTASARTAHSTSNRP